MRRIDWLIIFILIVNTIIAILYMIIRGIQTREKYVLAKGLVMILCPVTGIAMYIVPAICALFPFYDKVDYSNISMSKERMRFLQKSDKKKESQVMPVEEVLSVSAAQDKRNAILNLLKMDLNENVGLLRKAVENDDVETSHYAAAALTNFIGKASMQLNDLQATYDKNRSDLLPNMEYIDALEKLLDSHVLIGVEEKKYEYMLIHAIENLNQFHQSSVREEDYIHIIEALLETGGIMDAESWSLQFMKQMPLSEQAYIYAMKVKYEMQKEDDFWDIMEQLKNSKIPLSKEGLEIVRYWKNNAKRNGSM